MKFSILSPKDISRLETIYKQYTQTFPPAERRNRQQFFELLNHPDASIQMIQMDSKEVGYMVLWKLANAVFIEHFEIFKAFRNQQLGEKVLQYLAQQYDVVVLETEPDNYSELAARRINFYKRNGFFILAKNYLQPAYDKEKEPLTLFLMANTKQLNLDKIQSEIYQKVYHF